MNSHKYHKLTQNAVKKQRLGWTRARAGFKIGNGSLPWP